MHYRKMWGVGMVVALSIVACGGDDASATNSNPTDPANSSGSNPSGSIDIAGVAGTQAIYLHTEYTFGVGGYMVVEYRPYLMFRDGTVYKNLATSPDKLDIAASKAAEADEWGRWSRSGETFTLTWPDGDTDTWDEGDWYTTNPAPSSGQIAGAYHSISGGGNVALGGDALTFSSSNIAFEGNKFTYERTSGGSTSNVTAYGSQERAGTYVLDGYSIELRFNNGVTERKFFYFYPDSERVFGIGDVYYVIDD